MLITINMGKRKTFVEQNSKKLDGKYKKFTTKHNLIDNWFIEICKSEERRKMNGHSFYKLFCFGQ